jgi:molybdopterin-guanine dinucleotide biosynthesis protein B
VGVERVMTKLPGLDCGMCGTECEKLARAVVAGKRDLSDCRELPAMGVTITVGGNKLAMTEFPASFVDSAVRGMLSSLKGYVPGKDVEIRLEAKSGASKRRRK